MNSPSRTLFLACCHPLHCSQRQPRKGLRAGQPLKRGVRCWHSVAPIAEVISSEAVERNIYPFVTQVSASRSGAGRSSLTGKLPVAAAHRALFVHLSSLSGSVCLVAKIREPSCCRALIDGVGQLYKRAVIAIDQAGCGMLKKSTLSQVRITWGSAAGRVCVWKAFSLSSAAYAMTTRRQTRLRCW